MTARPQPTGDNHKVTKLTHNRPLFAQPINGSKFATPLPLSNKTGTWQRPFGWGLAVITCGVLLAFSLPNNAQNVPNAPKANNAQTAANGKRTIQVAQAKLATPANTTPTLEPLADVPDESRRPINFYTDAVRSNMFSAPQPPAQAVPKPIVVAKPQPVKPTPIPVPPINPFADWSYTGTITSDDGTTALLENTKTKQGEFVKSGDMFMGERVGSITDQSIEIGSGKAMHMLAKSDNITVTPLDRSAIPSTGQTGQPQTGQPAMPQTMQMPQQSFDMSNMGGFGRGRWGGFGGGNGQTFSLPNGRQFNPQQWQRRMQRMNQNFNQ